MKLHKIPMTILSVFLLTCMIITANATGLDITPSSDIRIFEGAIGDKASFRVIQNFVDAINSSNWNQFNGLFSHEYREKWGNFPNDGQIDGGLLDVDRIALAEIKEVSLDVIFENQPYTKDILGFIENYSSVKAHYVGFDYEVSNESQFFYNGVKYYFIITGSANGETYILSYESVYDFTDLAIRNISFNSDSERIAKMIVEKAVEGLYINTDGSVLQDNRGELQQIVIDIASSSNDSAALSSNDVSQLTLEQQNIYAILHEIDSYYKNNNSTMAASASVPTAPSSIRVKRVRNGGSGNTETVTFTTYLKNVLPNEWVKEWPSESLKSGAICVKHFAWYNVAYPRSAAQNGNYHVTDDSDLYQVYVPSSAQTATSSAVDNVINVVLRSSASNLFEASYFDGTKGQAGDAWSGRVQQYGTKFLAETFPEYDYKTLISYYYSYSSKSSGLVLWN